MGTTVGTFMLQRLVEWGVERVYGYPGDGINGILGGFHEVGDESSSSRSATRRSPPSPPARTRSSPARSASAWRPPAPARSTCSTGSTTPSSTTSRWSRSSASRRACSLGADYQQEVDLDALYKDVAGEFVQICMVPEQARAPDRPRDADRRGDALAHLRSSSPTTSRRSELRGAAARARRVFTSLGCGARRAVVPPHDALRARRRRPQRGREGRDAHRPGRDRRRGEVDQVADAARRRRGQGAQRPRRPARRPALRDRLDRAARHQAVATT